MMYLVYALWAMVGVGGITIFVIAIGEIPGSGIWVAGGATIGCAILAVIMNAVAAIGDDLYAIRRSLVGDLEDEETKIQLRIRRPIRHKTQFMQNSLTQK